jgi:beta-lactamase regulating signal transducer with metallopeptidase domain
MRTLGGILTQPAVRAIALALLHFLWQGALVALTLAAGNQVLRRSSARARYAAACAAMALLLVLPAVTVWRLQTPRAGTTPGFFLVSTGGLAATPPGTKSALPLPRTDPIATLAPWIVLAWVSGVCLFSIRLLGGHLTAQRLRHRRTRRPSAPWEARFRELAARLSVTRPVCLLESALVDVPTAIGILRPVVLVPAGILTGMAADQLDSLLAHELAHVRRGDCLVNLLQSLAETLLFYHPATWWVSERIRIERENACDDLAVAATGDAAAYARALVDLAERRAASPVLAVAADGGRLWNRVARLVLASEVSPGPSPRWLAAALALGGVLALGAAARVPPPDAGGQATTAATEETQRDTPQAQDPPRTEPTRGANGKPEADPTVARPRAAARPLLSPDQLIAFRIHGVTPEYIGEIVALGYTKASPEELVALRIHGVTPEYMAQMTAILGKLPLQRYTELRIHGLTPAVLQDLQAPFGKLDVDDALALRIHGVDAAFVKAFRDAGYSALSAEQAVSLRIHGVAAGDAAAWKSLGFGIPSIDDLVAMRIHGVTPQFARAIRAEGLEGASLEDLTALRIHGVTPEFVRAIRALGYTSLSAEDFTAFRIHGISAESIQAMNREAGQRLSAEDLVDWRLRERRANDSE